LSTCLACLAAELPYKARDPPVGESDAPELLGVLQCRCNVSGLRVEGNKRFDGIAIVRVLLQAVSENRDGVAAALGCGAALGSGSHATRRWREMDSNFQFRTE
jgi:hypothetical protein